MATSSLGLSKSEVWDASLSPPTLWPIPNPLQSTSWVPLHLSHHHCHHPGSNHYLSLGWLLQSLVKIHSSLWSQNVHLLTSLWCECLTSPSSLALPCSALTFQPLWGFLFLRYSVFVMASSTHMTLFVFLSPYLMPTLTSHLHLTPISSGWPPSPPPPDYTHPESDGPAICHKITKYSSFSRHGSFNFLTRKHQWEQSPCSPWHPRHLPLGWAIQRTCSMSECIFLHLFFNFHPASFSFLKPRILSSFMLFLPTYFLEIFLSSNSLTF